MYRFWWQAASTVCPSTAASERRRSIHERVLSDRLSPLYNADKIHTPLLFLHGSADTNVPIGESIQMFTALKLLGADRFDLLPLAAEEGIAVPVHIVVAGQHQHGDARLLE